MAITLMAPGGRGARADRTMAPRLSSLGGQRIALLANGKANAEALLQETAALFVRDFGCQVVGFVDKGNASRPALPEHHRQLAGAGDFLITAVGD